MGGLRRQYPQIFQSRSLEFLLCLNFIPFPSPTNRGSAWFSLAPAARPVALLAIKHPLSQARPIRVQEGRRSGGGETQGELYKYSSPSLHCISLRMSGPWGSPLQQLSSLPLLALFEQSLADLMAQVFAAGQGFPVRGVLASDRLNRLFKIHGAEHCA